MGRARAGGGRRDVADADTRGADVGDPEAIGDAADAVAIATAAATAVGDPTSAADDGDVHDERYR